jgi:hypothetical protein
MLSGEQRRSLYVPVSCAECSCEGKSNIRSFGRYLQTKTLNPKRRMEVVVVPGQRDNALSTRR